MYIELDLNSNEPLYRQLRAQVVHAIATGELQPGDALPSVRTLAGDLGINMHTVNKAYAVLRDEGYVAMRGRSGAYVADTSRATSSARSLEHEERMVQSMRDLALEAKARGWSRAAFLEMAQEQSSYAFPE